MLMIGWEAKASLVLTNAELKLKSHQMTRRKAKVFPSPHCSKSATKVHQMQGSYLLLVTAQM